MKKSIIIYILTLVYSLVNAQTIKNTASLLFFKENVKIKVYNNFNKDKVISCIYDDPIKENYYVLEVLDRKGNMLKISGSSILNNKANGWIESSNIGINTRSRDNKLVLYKDPNYKAKHIVIYQEDGELVRVTAISSSWLKIVLKCKNKIYNYWLPSEYQCPNPYTTCN